MRTTIGKLSNKASERAYNERQKKVIKRVSVRAKASERAYKSKWACVQKQEKTQTYYETSLQLEYK